MVATGVKGFQGTLKVKGRHLATQLAERKLEKVCQGLD